MSLVIAQGTQDVPAPWQRGGYTVRFATTPSDLERAQQLRHLCFVQNAGRDPLPNGLEQDRFDAVCRHVLIEDAAKKLVCSYRVLAFGSGADIHTSYSAQYYDLEQLIGYDLPMIELGRFCIDPTVSDPDVLRIAWGMLAAFVDLHGAGLLFGCSSFAGTNASAYQCAFNLLAARHLAPKELSPAARAPQTIPFAANAERPKRPAEAMAQIPTLLRTYLSMGGWVSDHAVVDHEMHTLHVFTGLEIAAIPIVRAKALRDIAP